MNLLKLVFKNIFRHKLRSMLTILGIAVTILAFGLLRTLIAAWYAGVEASADNRLITRNSVSFIFPLPLAYRDQIANVPGVSQVTYANWFQGIYIDQNQFFPRMAVDAETFFEGYPEFLITQDELSEFKKERNACVIGSIIAQRYNLRLGDIMQIKGDIYPGDYEFVVRGIYRPRDSKTDATQMFFHWNYLNEHAKEIGYEANMVGWYMVTVDNPDKSAAISEAIDALFRNSRAETKTETEAAFAHSFISMSDAILKSINAISIIIIGIIILVLANTMAMTERERMQEYAVLKTLGFSGSFLTYLIFGEALLISVLGGIIGILLTFPFARGVQEAVPAGYFPVFDVTTGTILLCVLAILIVSIFSSVYPVWKARSQTIVDGLRQIG